MNSKPYDIVLLPDIKITKESLRLSNSLKNHGVYFTLNNQSYFSHVSIYMLQLSDDGLKKAINFLTEFSKTINNIEAIAHSFNYTDGYFDLEYLKTDEISKLQEKIISELNPVRDGLREKDKQRLASADDETKANITEYGFRSVGKLFYPHLTFTRFKNDQKSILDELPSKEEFGGKFVGLGIFEIGDNGTCVKLVKKWKLARF